MHCHRANVAAPRGVCKKREAVIRAVAAPRGVCKKREAVDRGRRHTRLWGVQKRQRPATLDSQGYVCPMTLTGDQECLRVVRCRGACGVGGGAGVERLIRACDESLPRKTLGFRVQGLGSELVVRGYPGNRQRLSRPSQRICTHTREQPNAQSPKPKAQSPKPDKEPKA
jgi:hypothetical protein